MKHSKWYWAKELIGDVLIIWWGCWTAFVFAWVFHFGEMKVIEPTHWILMTELALCVAGFIVGVDRLIDDLRRLKKT